MDRVLLSKARSIERCLRRVREEYIGHEADFDMDYTRQDAAVLNLIRACEQTIDMADRMIHLRRLELVDEAAGAFFVLRRAGLIEQQLAEALKRMVGFQNVAVHEYQELDLAKVKAVIETRLPDLTTFTEAMLRADPTA